MKCERQAHRIRSKHKPTTVINTCVKSVKTKEAIYHTSVYSSDFFFLSLLCVYEFVFSSLRSAYQSKKKIRDRNFTLYTNETTAAATTTTTSVAAQQLYQLFKIYRKLSILCSN